MAEAPRASQQAQAQRKHVLPLRGMRFAAVFVTALLCSSRSEAQRRPNLPPVVDRETYPSSQLPAAEQSPPYVFSLRPSIGLGAGNFGIGVRTGVASEYWLTDYVGIGIAGATAGETQIFGSSVGVASIGPVIALRSATRQSYFIATLGPGYSQVKRTDGGGFCLNLLGDGECRRLDVVTRYTGYVLSTAVGWLHHPGRSLFEIGPIARFDVIADPDGHRRPIYAATINLELGLAILAPSNTDAM